MGYGVSGAGKAETPTYKTGSEKLTKALVVEEVRIIEVPRIVEIPVIKNIETEQIKYITKEEPQIRYKTLEKETVNFIATEQPTIKYIPREEETIKYIPKEVQVERPVPIPVEYEKPVIKEKIIEVVRHGDVAAMTELRDIVISLTKELKELQVEMSKIKRYKLVEQIVEVPKVQWINTPVERIVWKDVERVR